MTPARPPLAPAQALASSGQWAVRLHSTAKRNGHHDVESAAGAKKRLPQGLDVVEGRPNLREAISMTMTHYGVAAREVAVIACGPHALVADAEIAAGEAGCAFHKESFAL